MSDDNRWGDTYVTWKGFVSIIISMIIAGAGLFGYVLNMHNSQPHANAANENEIATLSRRIDRIETRTSGTLQRIEDKIDRLQENK